MEKYGKVLLLLCMIIGICVGCSEKTDVNQSDALSAEPMATVTLMPTVSVAAEQTVPETTISIVETEQIESATEKKAAKESKYAKWEYDEKTKCVTISGKGETNDDAAARIPEEDSSTGKFSVITPQLSNYKQSYGDWRREAKEVVIKEGVTAINTAAFATMYKLEKVTIPSSVKKMGAYVFYNCESLKEITIPDSVTFIDVECFYGCKSLRKITFGKKVKTIADGNFIGCESLREIVVKPGNKNLITKDGILYQKKKRILYFAYGNSRNVTIPDGTKKIGLCAFYMNPNLQTVTIPASVTLIKGGAFYHCNKLRKVTFAKHSKLKRIEEYWWVYQDNPPYQCFMYCKNLQEMIFPDSLEYANNSFVLCYSLKKIYLGKKFKGISPEYVGSFPIYYDKKNSLKEIVVSKKNKYFSSRNGVLFDKKQKVLIKYPAMKTNTKYVVPKSVDRIDNDAFYHCKNLKSLVIYGKNTEIETRALNGSKHVTIYGKKNSTAERFAKKKKMKFVAI